MSPSITPTQLDPVSEWRAWQTLIIIYTMLVNHQIRRRWLLEQKCMQNRPLRERFLPVLLLEPIPTLRRPYVHLINKEATNNPTNETIMDKLRTRVALLRARVEKGKELASEIERRMVQHPPIRFPTHFCHTCVEDGERVKVVLTTCGHRVCRICIEYWVNENGVYECSICFAPTRVVARSPVVLGKDYPGKVAPILKKGKVGRDRDVEVREN